MSELRRVRIDKHMTVQDLADVSEISDDQIRNIENGTTRNPRMKTLTALANALNVKPSQIDPMLTSPEPVEAK